MGQQRPKVINAEETKTDQSKKKKGKKISKVESKAASVEPAKVDEPKAESPKATKQSKSRKKNQHQRGHQYLAKIAQLDPKRIYQLDSALELLEKTSFTRFDPTVEAHFNLEVKKSKKSSPEPMRGMVSLPHGTGKKLKVEILDEAKIETIAQTKKIDFDLAVATPALMPKLAKIAKILGPRGKMPNPKLGTVGEDPEKIKKELETGKIEYRADSQNIIHCPLGKLSFGRDKLKENFLVLRTALSRLKIKKITFSTTMGPGIKVEI